MSPVSVWDGTQLLEVQPKITTETGTVPAKAGVIPRGYSSVSEMFRQSRCYVAHRGGSADFPEGSMYAYTQSVFWGAPALEFSLGRSSDGVFFQLHDQYLDRTSLGTSTTTLNPATMTWAQIQQYTINQFGKQKAYCKLTDVLDTYLSTHVIFLDPKYTTAFWADLWALLANYPGYQDKIVFKFSGGGVSVATQAHSHGCKAWGYYYPTDDLNAMVNTSGPQWDFLGMEVKSNGTYDANAWAQVLSLGKPVLGHICSTKLMADTAFAAGASGVMMSGVREVIDNGPMTFAALSSGVYGDGVYGEGIYGG